MLKAVQKYVGDVPPGREFSRDIPGEPPVLAPRTVTATFPKLGQARLELGFPSVRLQHQDLYALDLLATILGGGESSILVEDIRDKQQLVSAISVGDNTPSYVDGTFGIDMELDAAKIPQATKAVLDDLEKLKTEPIDAERIKAAKTQMRTAHIKSMQTAEEVASDLATSYMFTDDIHFNDLYVDRIEQGDRGAVAGDGAEIFRSTEADHDRAFARRIHRGRGNAKGRGSAPIGGADDQARDHRTER